MKFFKDLLRLFYPISCINCKTHLLKNELYLCTHCKHDLPEIPITNYSDNEIKESFLGKTSVNLVASLFYYNTKGVTKKIIHQLKYKNNQEIGIYFGDWLGNKLKESNEFNTIDFIVPVPLHPTKFKKRGYNQLTYFGEQLSKHLKTVYITDILTKTATTTSQTYKTRNERFNNTENTFHLTDRSIFNHKHILLIDDVITTGATLEACCKELQKTENIQISIATMAFTNKF